jgi:small subunit ribosomal protein S11e
MAINDKYRECDQTEKAYQKQDAIFIARKRVVGKKAKSMRYTKSIGLGFKTPKEASEGKYVDKKCPFTGNVSIRGRVLKGLVISAGKMKNTIVVRRDYLHYISKYRRYEKRHKNISVHCSPAFPGVKEGDVATIGQCRPLSKTVRFNTINLLASTNSALNVKKSFRMF